MPHTGIQSLGDFLDTAPLRGYDDDINKTTKGLIIMTRTPCTPISSIRCLATDPRGNGFCAAHLPISLIKEIDYCANCGADCAPTHNLYADPLCTACKHTMRADDTFLALPTFHDFAFALKEPAAAMPTNDPFEGYYREIGSWNL